MGYETFLITIKHWLQEQLGDDYKVMIKPVHKSHSVSLDGIAILSPGGLICLTLYLADYYEQLEKGQSITAIQDLLLVHYREKKASLDQRMDVLTQLDQVQDQILYTLIPLESNDLLLARLPHKPFLDLTLIFYLVLDRSDRDHVTLLIDTKQLNKWQLSQSKLVDLAYYNTPRLLPAHLETMDQLIKTIAQNQMGEDFDELELAELLEQEPVASPLYALTNVYGVLGACTILYPDLLKNFAKEKGQDLVILPSSAHEVLLLPHQEGMDYSQLNEMIATVNLSEVPMEDRLSNHVYIYHQEQDRISIPISSSELDEIVNLRQKWPLQ